MAEVSAPAITVIVPNYNHGRFLEQRLHSIFSQTYADFRVILLDDASTDGSAALFEPYQRDERVSHTEINRVNSGSPFAQWKKGIALADTEWIWIAESDDYCTPQLLESLQPAINDPDCVLAYVEVDEVDEAGNLLLERRTGLKDMVEGCTFIQKHLVLGTALVNAGMVLLRRSAVLASGEAFTGFRLCGDYWLHYQVALQGKVFAAGTRQAFFRRHPQEVSHSLLHSPVFINEMFSIFQHQLEKGLVDKKVARGFIQHQLHALACRKADLSPSAYSNEQSFWLNWASRIGITINNFTIVRKSFQSKLTYWWKKKYTPR